MTPQEVREQLKRLPKEDSERCLDAFEKYPFEAKLSRMDHENKIAYAIDNIDWEASGRNYYLSNLYNRANDGEFDTPQPDDYTMISVSSRHYNELKAKVDKYDRMAEIVKENAQNKKDEKG